MYAIGFRSDSRKDIVFLIRGNPCKSGCPVKPPFFCFTGVAKIKPFSAILSGLCGVKRPSRVPAQVKLFEVLLNVPKNFSFFFKIFTQVRKDKFR